MKPPNRRRRLLVGRIQHRFLAFQVAYFLVFAAVFATVTFGPLVIDLLDRTTPPLERAAGEPHRLHARVVDDLGAAGDASAAGHGDPLVHARGEAAPLDRGAPAHLRRWGAQLHVLGSSAGHHAPEQVLGDLPWGDRK